MSRAKLPIPIGRALDEGGACSERELQQMWHAVEAARRPGGDRQARPQWRGAFALAAIAAVLALASLQALRSRTPRALALAGGGPLPLTIAPLSRFRAVDLNDGSRITVARGSQLDMLESSARKLVLALRRGRARFDVRPHGPRAWQVECAGVTVQVVGTAFVVERTEEEVRVSVEHGVVLVRGEAVPDRVQRLSAGARLSARYAPLAPVGLVAPTAPSATPPDASASANDATRPAEGNWREAARRRKWSRAWRELREDGIEQQTRRADRVEDLLLLADVARLSGHPHEAVAPLERVTAWTRDARAGLAAFTLGRLQLDELDDPARAAEALSRALTLGLPAALEHDARARLVEAYARAGLRERARAAAADYHSRYPRGGRAEQVDRWSGRD
jgi:transmembrane sensor